MVLWGVTAVVLCLLLAHWQYGRMYRPVDGYGADAVAVPLASLLPAGRPVPSTTLTRLVTVNGSYAGKDQVIVADHSLEGQPVSWVVTPLTMSDGTSVLVVRGWVGANSSTLTRPPAGDVKVTGRLATGPLGPGVNARERQGLSQLRPGYLIRTAQSPPDPLSLQPVPVAAPSGPAPLEFHLQNAIYVVQWLLLAVIVAVSLARLYRADRRARA